MMRSLLQALPACTRKVAAADAVVDGLGVRIPAWEQKSVNERKHQMQISLFYVQIAFPGCLFPLPVWVPAACANCRLSLYRLHYRQPLKMFVYRAAYLSRQGQVGFFRRPARHERCHGFLRGVRHQSVWQRRFRGQVLQFVQRIFGECLAAAEGERKRIAGNPGNR